MPVAGWLLRGEVRTLWQLFKAPSLTGDTAMCLSDWVGAEVTGLVQQVGGFVLG